MRTTARTAARTAAGTRAGTTTGTTATGTTARATGTTAGAAAGAAAGTTGTGTGTRTGWGATSAVQRASPAWQAFGTSVWRSGSYPGRLAATGGHHRTHAKDARRIAAALVTRATCSGDR